MSRTTTINVAARWMLEATGADDPSLYPSQDKQDDIVYIISVLRHDNDFPPPSSTAQAAMR